MQTNKLREALVGLLDVMHDMGIDEDTVAIAAESRHCCMHSKKHLDAIKKAKAALAPYHRRHHEVASLQETPAN
jgi:hypothetical protein